MVTPWHHFAHVIKGTPWCLFTITMVRPWCLQMSLHDRWLTLVMSPTKGEGEGTYNFLCGSRRHRRPQCSLSALYLLNQWMDFDQTCIDTFLWGRKAVIRFWWPWPDFQGRHTITTVEMSLICTLSPKPIGRFWPNLHRSTTETWEKWLDFGDLDLIFNVTPTHWISYFDQKI